MNRLGFMGCRFATPGSLQQPSHKIKTTCQETTHFRFQMLKTQRQEETWLESIHETRLSNIIVVLITPSAKQPVSQQTIYIMRDFMTKNLGSLHGLTGLWSLQMVVTLVRQGPMVLEEVIVGGPTFKNHVGRPLLSIGNGATATLLYRSQFIDIHIDGSFILGDRS